MRLAKNCKVSGLALRSSTQSELSFSSSDGKLVFLSLRSSETPGPEPLVILSRLNTDLSVRLSVSSVMPGLGQVSHSSL